MSVTEKLQALGMWSVNLHHTCPPDVQRRLERYGHVIITEREIPYRQMTDSQILAASRYTGIVRLKSLNRSYSPLEKPAPGINDITLEGVSLLGHLGDEDDKGAVLETAAEFTSETFANTIRALLPDSIQEGTLHSVAGAYSGRHYLESPRAAIDYVCKTLDAEYRVNSDGTLDAGAVEDLYQTAPTAVIVRKPHDRHDPLYEAIPLRAADIAYDVSDWTSRVVLVAEGEGEGVAIADADIAENPYLDLFGNPLQRTRIVNEPETAGGNAASRAAMQLGRFSSEKNAFRISIDEFVQEGVFALGDYVWFYDPPDYVGDDQIRFRGEIIRPVAIRVIGFTWPVQPGSGVYYRTAAGEYIDLSPWVRFETSTSEDVELGDFRKELGSDASRTILSTRLQPDDGSTPDVPTLETPFLTSAYVNVEGVTRARIVVEWATPLNVDGSTVLDGDRYEIRWRADGETAYSYSAVAWGINQFTLEGLEPGGDYDIGVQAVDVHGNQSGYGTDAQVIAQPDDVPPSQPAAPTVAGSTIQLMVMHDLGRNTGGTFNLEDDLDHLDVYVATVDDFTPSSGSYVGAIPATVGNLRLEIPVAGRFQVEDTATRFVKVIAVDHAGNESDPSPQATESIDLIDTAVIADLAVTDAKIQNLSATKIEAGAIAVGEYIESSDYITGVSGWRITGDGPAEFSDVIVRGEIEASVMTASIIISPHPAGGYIEFNNGRLGMFNNSDLMLGSYSVGASDGTTSWFGTNGAATQRSRIQLPGSTTSFPLAIGTFHSALDIYLESGRDLELAITRDILAEAAAYDIHSIGAGGIDIDAFNNGSIEISANGTANILLAAFGDTIQIAADTVALDSDLLQLRTEAGTSFGVIFQTSADAFVVANGGASSNGAMRVRGGSDSSIRDVSSMNRAADTYRAMRASAFTVSSDRKWKRDIHALPARHVRDAAAAVAPVEYTDADTGEVRLGFVANDLPAAVRRDSPARRIRVPAGDRRVTSTMERRQVRDARGRVTGTVEVPVDQPEDRDTVEVDDPSAGAAYDLSALLAVAWARIDELEQRVEAMTP